MSEASKREMVWLKQKEQMYSFYSFLFYSGPQCAGWWPHHWQEQSPLLNLLIQVLTSSGHTFGDTPRNHASIPYLAWSS